MSQGENKKTLPSLLILFSVPFPRDDVFAVILNRFWGIFWFCFIEFANFNIKQKSTRNFLHNHITFLFPLCLCVPWQGRKFNLLNCKKQKICKSADKREMEKGSKKVGIFPPAWKVFASFVSQNTQARMDFYRKINLSILNIENMPRRFACLQMFFIKFNGT